jgi:LysR family transcriptional regulator, mexEF-oprN operon transcriptional activator
MPISTDAATSTGRIDYEHIGLFDLNLLVAFDALISERNVTRAALALGVSQPTMSHSLSRLRQLCGDDLFVRTKGGMRPTARAVEIAPEVRSVLQLIQSRVIGDDNFAPGTSTRGFKIAMSDCLEALLLPGLVEHLHQTAPGMSIIVCQPDERTPRELLDVRRLDLLIGTYEPDSQAHHVAKLWTDCGVVLHRPEAAGSSGAMDLATFRNGRHVMFGRTGDSVLLVENFARYGFEIHPVVTTSHLFTVPYLVLSDNLFAPVPCVIGRHLSRLHGLAATRLPSALLPYFSVNMLWHSSTDNDPANQWLREVIQKIVHQANPLAGAYGSVAPRLAGAEEYWEMSEDYWEVAARG